MGKDNTIIYDLDEDEDEEETSSDDEDEEETSSDEEDEDESTSSDEEDESTSSDEEDESTSSDEEEDKKIVDHTKLQRLKTLLKGGSVTNQSFNKDGLYIKQGGSRISQDRFNSDFRGWGFTFF